MNKETIEEAANNWLDSFYQKEKEYDKTGRNKCSPQLGFVAGAEWQKEQSDKQWTDEDMLSAFKAGTDNEILVETGIGMYPNHQHNPEEWLKLYKQSKSNADN